MAIEHILGLVLFIVIVLSLSLVLPTNSRRTHATDGDGGSVGSFSDGGGDCGGGDGGGGD